MTKKKNTKIVREGNYLAEVDIELIDSSEGWGRLFYLWKMPESWMKLEKRFDSEILKLQLRKPKFLFEPIAV